MAIDNNTALGWQRFDYFLQQLQAAFDKAGATEDAALLLYQQNVRTPLFMLEALTRLYKDILNKKRFKKFNELFKDFEDKLGAIDYYDGFGKEFSNKENIPQAVKDFIKAQMENRLADLRQMLEENGWTGNDNKRMQKITTKLQEANWPAEEEDASAIKTCYQETIAGIVENIKKNKISFQNVEADVHELRRELRWLSIYPQALRGLIQMKPSVNSPEYLKKYLVPEIVNSPFNKMPEPGGLKNIIYVDADHFYALSWLIAELGKLKDNGLRIIVLKEALQSINKLNDEEAEKQALALCGEGQMKTADILQKSKEISDQFFKEKIPEQLVIE